MGYGAVWVMGGSTVPPNLDTSNSISHFDLCSPLVCVLKTCTRLVEGHLDLKQHKKGELDAPTTLAPYHTFPQASR